MTSDSDARRDGNCTAAAPLQQDESLACPDLEKLREQIDVGWRQMERGETIRTTASDYLGSRSG